MNNPVAVTLGANLRRIRESKGVTRKQLADAVNTTADSIAGYEIGKRLAPLDKILEIANFLEVSVVSLTGDNEFNPNFPVFPSVGCTNRARLYELQAQLKSIAHSLLVVARQLDD